MALPPLVQMVAVIQLPLVVSQVPAPPLLMVSTSGAQLSVCPTRFEEKEQERDR
ncbi:hypothetical protein CA13_55830 [Planctomycetes bacterium CA13]|uniref:Uncharacterized protein n=1 Tax=Novipirellula herctigrandis TaxID=2527986 RepID=A0A5C5ZAJ4_9BACT|nr:hypothetical protein CA13_55830 [Planctomycetes bacterium CA13]